MARSRLGCRGSRAVVPDLDEPATLEPGGANAIGRMLGLLGDEWNLLIIQQALMGASRYGHFTARLPVSNSVLTTRLRMLVDEGLLSRRATGYLPTARSRSLWPILVLIWEWERSWVAEHRERLPAMRHQRCDELFSPLLRCAACGAAINGDDVDLFLGPSGGWSRSAPAASTRRRSESDAATRQARPPRERRGARRFCERPAATHSLAQPALSAAVATSTAFSTQRLCCNAIICHPFQVLALLLCCTKTG